MFLNIAHTKHLKLQGLQSTRSPPGPPARTRAPWPAPGFTWYKGAAPPARLSSWYCAGRNRLAIMQMQWRHLRGRQLVRLVRALTARRAVVLHLSMQTETEKQSPKQKGTKVILHKMSATTSSVIIGTSSLIHHWPPCFTTFTKSRESLWTHQLQAIRHSAFWMLLRDENGPQPAAATAQRYFLNRQELPSCWGPSPTRN